MPAIVNKKIIHFAHGNGFPARTYNQFIQALQPWYEIIYVDRIGHNPKYPVNDNWDNLVYELIESIENQAKQPVIAVGHSMGGILSLRAAVYRPDLISSVILLDAPILGPIKSRLVKYAKMMGLIDKLTPAQRTKFRRQSWSSREELFNYLKSKALFANFSDASLNDYIQYGFEVNAGNYNLYFERNVEYQIYRNLPHSISGYHTKIQTPVALIYGENTSVMWARDIANMQRKYNMPCYATAGGHLFPFQFPIEAAAKVYQVIENMYSSRSIK